MRYQLYNFKFILPIKCFCKKNYCSLLSKFILVINIIIAFEFRKHAFCGNQPEQGQLVSAAIQIGQRSVVLGSAPGRHLCLLATLLIAAEEISLLLEFPVHLPLSEAPSNASAHLANYMI